MEPRGRNVQYFFVKEIIEEPTDQNEDPIGVTENELPQIIRHRPRAKPKPSAPQEKEFPKPQKTVFRCKLCEFDFKTAAERRLHEKRCRRIQAMGCIEKRKTRKVSIPCPQCGKTFRRKQSQLAHMSVHDEEEQAKPFQCLNFNCSKEFKTEMALKRHLHVCCSICGFSCKMRAAFLAHLQIHEEGEEDKENMSDANGTEDQEEIPDEQPERLNKQIVNCLYCNEKFQEGDLLQAHMIEFHQKLLALSDNEDEYILP